MNMTSRIFTLVTASVWMTLVTPPAAIALQITDLDYVRRPDTPTGLSGITYAGGNLYYTVNDSGGEVYPLTFDVDLSTGKITSNVSVGTKISVGGIDLEGIAYNPVNNSVWVSDETGATIKEYALDGTLLGSVAVPANLRAYRGNFSLESLTMRGDGLVMWTSNEEALYNSTMGVDDGPLSTTTVGSIVRLTRFTRPDVHAEWTASGQWAYTCDPIEGSPYQNSERSGVADLCILPDNTLLVLEREMSVKGWFGIPSFRTRIYTVNFSGASDVSAITSLNGASYTKTTKTRLLDKNAGASNYEGICLGPRLNDGSLSLILVSDGDGSADKRLYALKLSGLDVWTLDVISAAGTAYPVNGPWRYLAGATVTATVSEPAPELDARTVCTGWDLTNHTPGSGTETTCTFSIANDAQLTWNWATEATDKLPIKESFESYSTGLIMDGINGWEGEGEIKELAYTAPTPPGLPIPETTHTKIMEVSGWTSRTIDGDKDQNVNVDLMLQAVQAEKLEHLATDVQTALCVYTNGLLHAWHAYFDGSSWTRRWTALSAVPIKADQWVRISISTDYSSSPTGETFFCPRLNGSLCPTPYGYRAPDDLRSPGCWYHCADNPENGGGGAKQISSLVFNGTGQLDDLVVSTESFAHTGPVSTNGIPFVWFDKWGLARNPDSDLDEDGFTAAEEYTAGTDPTDANSVFRVIATWTADDSVYVQFIGNDSGSPTPYVMERATDLKLGDWSVVDDSIPRITAPQTINTWSEPLSQQEQFFYRVKALAAP